VLKRQLTPRLGRGPVVPRGSGVIIVDFRREQVVPTDLSEYGETLGVCSFMWNARVWRAFVLKGSHDVVLLSLLDSIVSQKESAEFSVIGGTP